MMGSFVTGDLLSSKLFIERGVASCGYWEESAVGRMLTESS
jgi:hypothetical protein